MHWCLPAVTFAVIALHSPAASNPARARLAASPPAPGIAAVECLPLLQWEQAHVDRAGNLWALAEQGTAVRRLSRDGRPIEQIEVPGVRAFDADAEWGLVALDRQGRQLLWWRPSATEPVAHQLPWQAGHVAWLDAAEVAVSTTAASDAVVAVDPQTGKVISVLLGGEEEIRPGPGAILLRSLVLAPDLDRRRLYVLDSLSGRLRLVSFDGRVLAEGQAAAHKLPEILDWLADVDREAKAGGTIQTPFYNVLRPEVGPSGGAIVVEQCNEARDRGTFALIAGGEIERRELRLRGPYCSLNFVLWGDQVVFAPPDSQVSWQCESPWRNEDDGHPQAR